MLQLETWPVFHDVYSYDLQYFLIFFKFYFLFGGELIWWHSVIHDIGQGSLLSNVERKFW